MNGDLEKMVETFSFKSMNSMVTKFRCPAPRERLTDGGDMRDNQRSFMLYRIEYVVFTVYNVFCLYLFSVFS